MSAHVLTVAAAVLSLATGDTLESELDKYLGTWVLVSEEFEGKKVPAKELADQLKKLSYTVRGDKILFASNGEERSATIKLGPHKDPKTYDQLRDDGRSLNGIYTWDGFKTIKICAADDYGDRPTEFRTGPGSKNRIRVWKRQP
jgi:uncharacterized protein (TIGR03067 family)